MSNYYAGEVVYKTVRIDEHEYQVPEAVLNHLEKLANALADEKAQHEKEYAKLQKVATKDFNKVADCILSNLNHGLPPISVSRFSSTPKFDRANRCLAYSIDTYFKTDSFGEPIFEFKDESKRRIVNGLMLLTVDGNDYK